jgi:redox-sensitive bicupin YhaK (pirin superfamily)
MESIFYKADTRGHVKIDWLESHHTFSFATYHNPDRMNFGLMRVLNDDYVKPSTGFDPHSHQNMEIITIPIKGSLFHQDHLGNRSTIQKGEVQIMSAGTGIMHSEHNPSGTEDVNLFQIWIYPKEKQIMPRYGQKAFSETERVNKLQCVVSPDEKNGSLWINQDAYIYLGKLERGKTISYKPQRSKNGIFLMIISGQVEVGKQKLDDRDAIGIWNTNEIDFKASNDSDVVLFEVPMN